MFRCLLLILNRQLEFNLDLSGHEGHLLDVVSSPDINYYILDIRQFARDI
jgi:hypothetical protein